MMFSSAMPIAEEALSGTTPGHPSWVGPAGDGALRQRGRWLAVGGDAGSSFSRGVSVTNIKSQVRVISGVLAPFAGVLDAAFIGYVDGSFGATMELSAIAAAVLGGCHLTGGRILLVGILFGAFILRGIRAFPAS